jgi:chloramphenicol 3-O phosphotransferase
MGADTAFQVVVLNGGSSSGKSSLCRAFQNLRQETWLRVGVDTVFDMLAPRVAESLIGADGAVSLEVEEFRRAEEFFRRGVAEMVRAGARVLIDEVFLSGPAGADRWREALAGASILWLGVRCDPAEAERRERARGDRVPGMARIQATLVHRGMHYDLELDTTATDPKSLAEALAARLASSGQG